MELIVVEVAQRAALAAQRLPLGRASLTVIFLLAVRYAGQ
jgi:hypothetical protein